MNPELDGLLYRCWHLRDVAWMEDSTGKVATIYRKWKPTAADLIALFPKTVHPKPSPTADPQRPTIDFATASGNQNTPPSPAQSLHEGDENRPIIRFE
jgi:hypothetical protein